MLGKKNTKTNIQVAAVLQKHLVDARKANSDNNNCGEQKSILESTTR